MITNSQYISSNITVIVLYKLQHSATLDHDDILRPCVTLCPAAWVKEGSTTLGTYLRTQNVVGTRKSTTPSKNTITMESTTRNLSKNINQHNSPWFLELSRNLSKSHEKLCGGSFPWPGCGPVQINFLNTCTV